VLAIELARQLLDLQSLVRDQSGIVGSPGPGDRKFRLHPRRSGALASSAALRASISSGKSSRVAAMPESNHKSWPLTRGKCGDLSRALRPNVWRGFANLSRRPRSPVSVRPTSAAAVPAR